jgi:predicted dehydrogenase
LIEAVDRNGVKLELAEQYCRDPLHRIKRQAIESGLIGEVLRVYALFQTGGYHIVSSIRQMVGDVAASRVTGIVMDSPIPRVNVSEIRQFTGEHWTMDVIAFENGATALTSYSAMYHGRALGRKSKTLFQVDGTTGTIVEDEVYVTTEEQRLNGGRATAYPIQTVTREVDGTQVLERMVIETDPPVVWENPWPHYKTSPGGLAIVEEMDSIAQAVLEDRSTRYDGRRARQDIEIQIAAEESGHLGQQPVELPLQTVTEHEAGLLEKFRQDYGCDPFDVEACVDVFFPKR